MDKSKNEVISEQDAVAETTEEEATETAKEDESVSKNTKKKEKKKKERTPDRKDLMTVSRVLIWITTGFVTASSLVFLSVVLGILTPEVQKTIIYYVNVYLPVMFVYVGCWLTSAGIVLYFHRYPTWQAPRKLLSALTVINLLQVIFQMVAWYYMLSGI